MMWIVTYKDGREEIVVAKSIYDIPKPYYKIEPFWIEWLFK